LLARLLARLDARRPFLETFEAYYDGHQPLAFASQRFRDAFGSRFREFSSNFMSLVVDAPAERLEVQGFRFRDAEGDADVWRRVWQQNDLYSGSELAHTEALMKGIAYAIVEPQPGGHRRRRPRLHRRDRRQGSGRAGRRSQAVGGRQGHLVAFVHLPDAVH
jgi:hypothetical protein